MNLFPVRAVFFFLLICTLSLTAQDKYWIFFTDKGQSLSKVNWVDVQRQFSERSLERRRLRSRGKPLLNMTDVPVWSSYLKTLEQRGITPVVVSNWLNAVSARLDEAQLSTIRKLDFVADVRPVRRGRRRPEPESFSKSTARLSSGVLDYGDSFTQNALINVPEVHATGITGKGVLIALLDTGYSLVHEAFNDINIIATFDFINDDENVDNEEGEFSNQNSHGTKVLSIIGGYAPGNLIGPAFGANYLLAKTEDVSSETSVEEDYWIAAAEWADRLGADIISSSLGYIDWYEYSDMNGQTAQITRAADMAVEKGIVVVVSAGNEGDTSWRYITAPADGFNVITVGAVDEMEIIAPFSSLGPTSDGRIKPEVVAMGVNNVHVYPGGAGYGRGNGTSFACPMVAGTAALILSAHPELTPRQVRQALVQTADRATQPDNVYGWGLVDALQAVNYWGAVTVPAEENRLLSVFPNPFSYQLHDGLTFSLDLKEFSEITIELYNILGQRLGPIIRTSLPASQKRPVWWNGISAAGKRLPSGVYFYRVRIGEYQKLGKVTVLQ